MDQLEQNKEQTALQRYTRLFKAQATAWYRKYLQKGIWWKLPVIFFSSVLVFVLVLILLVRAGTFGSLPTINELKDIRNHAASEVYTEDGVVLGKYFIENRTNVDYIDISPHIINALVATEDARFFDHSGIDLRAWVRVFFKTVLMRDDSGGGGSTLSQQLAKNLYPRDRYRFLSIPINKIREMYVARRLERLYSKDELLALYLNTVPFSRNIFGVEVAAQQFFNTNAKDIKPEQAAVLVGMLKGNSLYDPVGHPERAKKRRNVVLSQMEKYEYLEAAVSDSLESLDLIINYRKEGHNEGLGTYFREHLRQELDEKLASLKKPDGSKYNLYTDGLKIYTTIDSRMQSYAEKSVSETLSRLQQDFDKHWKGRTIWRNDEVLQELIEKTDRYETLKKAGASDAQIKASFDKVIPMTVFSWDGQQQKELSPLDSIKYYYAILNAGFMAMEPATGKVKAWVGGIDHAYFKYDHVKSKRQVGSIFKPIVYARALQSGIYPCDYIDNQLVTYTQYGNWQPQNADGHYGGVYSMEGALTKSVNSVSVDLIMRAGIDSTRLLAYNMGMTGDIPKGPAIALGAVDASLYDMMKVYGTLANRGRRTQPIYITRIETAEGTLVEEYKNEDSRRVLRQDEADLMIQMMKSVVDSGTAQRLRYLYKLPNDIAGKTGTTQSHADGWFMGFTPNLVAGAWVGGEYPSVRFRSLSLGQGASTALPIWGRFMQKVNADPAFKPIRNARFPRPTPYLEEMLDCDPYLEEMPLFAEDGLDVEEGIERLLDVFRRDKDDERINENSGRSPRVSKQSERIRKNNERLKRKREREKNRKKFFDKIFKN